jgi:hypothetical protein
MKYLRVSGGSSLAELGPALIVATMVLLAIFGMMQLINGVKINDSAAAEAVRVVAAGDPVSANARAQIVVDHANQQSTAWGSTFSLVSITFNPTNIVSQEAAMVPNGGMLTGNATVVTQLSFSPLGSGMPPVKINSQKSCPFSYNVPNTAGGVPVVSQ